MNNGSKRRSRKKYRIRYDRIIAVVLVLIVIIFIITSCTKGCSDKKNKDETSQTSVVDELTGGNAAPSADPNGQGVTDPSANTPDQPVSGAAAEYTTENVDYARISNGDLVLVNSLYPYKFQEGDVNLVTLFDNRNDYYKVKDNIVQLDSNVITQLNALMQAYAAAAGNTDLSVIGGYRTAEEQKDKYDSGTSKFPGGYSEYHTGRTFDLGIFPTGADSYYYSTGGAYAWFGENAANYGFVVRFPEGKDAVTGEEARTYTYRYVGVPHAVYMTQNNLCLEEYIEQIKTYTSTNPLTVTAGTSQYQIYYAAANPNAPTAVPVPSNRAYTISGNNVDGFIVTVTVA